MSEQRWLQLVCHTKEENTAAIESAMEEYRALSITLQDKFDDPVLEPLPGEVRLWKELIVTALFDYETNLGPLETLLNKNKEACSMLEKLESEFPSRSGDSLSRAKEIGDKLHCK